MSAKWSASNAAPWPPLRAFVVFSAVGDLRREMGVDRLLELRSHPHDLGQIGNLREDLVAGIKMLIGVSSSGRLCLLEDLEKFHFID